MTKQPASATNSCMTVPSWMAEDMIVLPSGYSASAKASGRNKEQGSRPLLSFSFSQTTQNDHIHTIYLMLYKGGVILLAVVAIGIMFDTIHYVIMSVGVHRVALPDPYGAVV